MRYSELKDPNYLQSGLTSNNSYSGNTATMLVYSNSKGMFAPLVWTVNGFAEACANNTSTMPCDALALEEGAGSKKVLLTGFVRNNAWSFVKGPVYVSATSGELTQTAPSADNDNVQIVGYAYNTNVLKFTPDLTTVTMSSSKVNKVMGFELASTSSGSGTPDPTPEEDVWFSDYFDNTYFEPTTTESAEWDGSAWVPTSTSSGTVDISPKTTWNDDYRPDYIRFGITDDPQDVVVTIYDINDKVISEEILTTSGSQIFIGHIWDDTSFDDIGRIEITSVKEEDDWDIGSIEFLTSSSGFNWSEMYDDEYFEAATSPTKAVWNGGEGRWEPDLSYDDEISINPITTYHSWLSGFQPDELKIEVENDPGDLVLTIQTDGTCQMISSKSFKSGESIVLKGLWGMDYGEFSNFHVESTGNNTGWYITSIKFFNETDNVSYQQVGLGCRIYGDGDEVILLNKNYIESGVEYDFRSTLGGGEGAGYMIDHLTFETPAFYQYNTARTLTISAIEFYDSGWDNRTSNGYWQNPVGMTYNSPNWEASLDYNGAIIGINVYPAAGGEAAWATDYYPTKVRITYSIAKQGGEGGEP